MRSKSKEKARLGAKFSKLLLTGAEFVKGVFQVAFEIQKEDVAQENQPNKKKDIKCEEVGLGLDEF